MAFGCVVPGVAICVTSNACLKLFFFLSYEITCLWRIHKCKPQRKYYMPFNNSVAMNFIRWSECTYLLPSIWVKTNKAFKSLKYF